jgi:cell division protein FtsW (lipid II flippase)
MLDKAEIRLRAFFGFIFNFYLITPPTAILVFFLSKKYQKFRIHMLLNPLTRALEHFCTPTKKNYNDK